MSYIQLPLTGASPYWSNAVNTAAALPAVGDVIGQVSLVLDTEALYYWDGAAWEVLLDGPADVVGPASATDNALALFNGTTGKIIKAATAITASRGLVSNASGVPVAATTTATEIGYVNGVTSAIQTQIDTKAAGAASSTDHAIARFDLATGKVLQNSGVTIDDSNNVEGAARVNATTAKVGGTGAAATSTVLELSGTTGALLLTRLTTVQRDALTPTDGMCLYNATTNKVQVRENGSWNDVTGWGS